MEIISYVKCLLFMCTIVNFFPPAILGKVKYYCGLIRKEEFEKKERQYKSAMELAKYLIRRDTSWEVTDSIHDLGKPKIHRYGANPNASSGHLKAIGEISDMDNAETPLILATKSGCVDIVKEILHVYPQTIEHIDDEGRNILHVAIKYRQLKIFEHVENMEVPMIRLKRKTDNLGNTLLHMVGIKRTDYVSEKLEGPALVLQDELLWYQRVEKVSLHHFKNHRNNMGFTAEELFATANNELRAQSKEWSTHTAEGCSVVAVLIATVAFAAAYTVPGGANEDTGYPILLNHPFFVIFTISDVLSLTFSLASVVTFLSILSSSFRLHDFRKSLPWKLTLGFTFLFLSVCFMMIAFEVTILLMIKNNENWAKITLYSCSFIPIAIFAISFFPLYIAKSIGRACKYLWKKTWPLIIPQCFVARLKRFFCFFKISLRVETTSSHYP